MTEESVRPGTAERGGRQWLSTFMVGLLLWVATVLVTFWTGNANLVPTVILRSAHRPEQGIEAEPGLGGGLPWRVALHRSSFAGEAYSRSRLLPALDLERAPCGSVAIALPTAR
jgi:hypothetical protein